MWGKVGQRREKGEGKPCETRKTYRAAQHRRIDKVSIGKIHIGDTPEKAEDDLYRFLHTEDRKAVSNARIHKDRLLPGLCIAKVARRRDRLDHAEGGLVEHTIG